MVGMAIEQGPPTADNPWPVALLGAKLRDWIDRLGTAWVEGEITQWNVAGGNVYGKLKDVEVDATVSFSIWSSVRSRVPADLGQGARVVAAVKPNYWVKGGSLTMQVVEMKHVGLGDLLERLERLRRTLAAEGLFDPSRKKRLPFLPHRIGLITGKDSDAEKDVKRNAQLRWPQVEFRTVHTAVQGERAVGEVTAAIVELDADPTVDVIIVARGGGDFQNLLGFSDEGLVRTAAAATTPSSPPSGTRRTARSSTRSPTCAPPPPRTPRSAWCPTWPRSSRTSARPGPGSGCGSRTPCRSRPTGSPPSGRARRWRRPPGSSTPGPRRSHATCPVPVSCSTDASSARTATSGT